MKIGQRKVTKYNDTPSSHQYEHCFLLVFGYQRGCFESHTINAENKEILKFNIHSSPNVFYLKKALYSSKNINKKWKRLRLRAYYLKDSDNCP